MQSEKTDETPEKMVIPLFEIVVYPESRTKFQVDQATGELLLEAMKDEETCTCHRPHREKRHPAPGTDRRIAV